MNKYFRTINKIDEDNTSDIYRSIFCEFGIGEYAINYASAQALGYVMNRLTVKWELERRERIFRDYAIIAANSIEEMDFALYPLTPQEVFWKDEVEQALKNKKDGTI